MRKLIVCGNTIANQKRVNYPNVRQRESKNMEDMAEVTIENGKIVIKVNGETLMIANKIGIQVRDSHMSEAPCAGRDRNTVYCCGDVDFFPIE